ncbi:MAG: GAF domain-containing protein [Rhodospirillaceae bacterium]|nr:GAF domain-containing protein [Rhodospirillaceae bacterium]
MYRFTVKHNIERFQRLLHSEVESSQRKVLEELLANAKRELSALEGIWSWTCPHLNISASLGDKAEKMLDHVVTYSGADYGSMQLWDSGDNCLRLIAQCNFDPSFTHQFAAVRKADGTVCEAAINAAETVVVEDLEATETFASLRDWARKKNIRAIQSTPVFGQSGKLIGAFSTHYIRPHSCSPKDQELFARCAAEMRSAFA